MHFAEEASYFITFCLDDFHKHGASFVKTNHKIICSLAKHKTAVGIRKSKGIVLENFQYIRIARLYYIKTSFS